VRAYFVVLEGCEGHGGGEGEAAEESGQCEEVHC